MTAWASATGTSQVERANTRTFAANARSHVSICRYSFIAHSYRVCQVGKQAQRGEVRRPEEDQLVRG